MFQAVILLPLRLQKMRLHPNRVAKVGACFLVLFFLVSFYSFKTDRSQLSSSHLSTIEPDEIPQSQSQQQPSHRSQSLQQQRPAMRTSDSNLISYENHKMIVADRKRSGPGERGRAIKLEGEEAEKAAKFTNQNGFNTYISDLIALDRSIYDIRFPQCKKMLYLAKLPSVSIIIPFLEEHWSTLWRTVVTHLKHAPEGLIKEVILVDDGSKREYLKKPLDDYVAANYPDGKVKVLRHALREGLIRARITGAQFAVGEVLVFLDSHCEAHPNWLPPLLDPIARDYRTVTCPFIDVINADTFKYVAQDQGARGAFDWSFFYKRLPRLPEDAAHPEQPFDSPIMAGGLFAINAKWFWELGGYDPGLFVWGGEQYELSFKIWMCGGRMIDIPCSRIGHIYRKYPSDFPPVSLPFDAVSRNYK